MANENKQVVTEAEEEEKVYGEELIKKLVKQLYGEMWGLEHCATCGTKLTKTTGKYRGLYPSRLACYSCKCKWDVDVASGRILPGCGYEEYSAIWPVSEDKSDANGRA